jgi:arylsulfatase A-like enzyme
LHPARDHLVAAAWLALACGIAEGLVLGTRAALGHFIWSGRHVGWMAPLSYLAFFGASSLGAAAIAALRPAWAPLAWAGGAFAAVGTAAWLRLVSLQRLHPLSIAVVALAVGVQVVRGVRRDPVRWARFTRRSLPALAGVVLVWGAGSSTWWWWRERRALEALPSARAGAPNVLLLILDTVRAASLSLYGYGRPTTPNIERLAAGGVTFDWAFAPAPWTLPSHGSLFSGRPPWQLSGGFLRPFDRRVPVVAEVLASHGYVTAGFVANHYYVGWESGLGRGFAHFEDYRISPKQILLSSELGQVLADWNNRLILRSHDPSPAPLINARFRAWLPRAGDRPYFAVLNYMEAHLPYRTPRAWEARFAGDSAKVDRYDAAVAYLDAAVGDLLDSLDGSGALANTIVIVTSDHGEQLGEHGIDDHGNSLYLPLLRVPLVIAYPAGGVPAGARVAAPADLRHLAATIVDLTDSGALGELSGASLRSWWLGQPADSGALGAQLERHPTPRSWYRNRDGAMWSLLDGPHHVIRNADGSLEVYEYRADPLEERDVAASAALAPRLTRWRTMFDSLRAEAVR